MNRPGGTGRSRWSSNGTNDGKPNADNKPRPHYRGASFYEKRYTDDAWSALRDRGEYPEGEAPRTALIAAYLLGMKEHHRVDMPIAAPEIDGQIGKRAEECYAYFLAASEEDEIAAIKTALDYVRWFVTVDDEWLQDKRKITLCFSPKEYRDHYTTAKLAKARRMKGRGALATADNVRVVSEEERTKIKGVRL